MADKPRRVCPGCGFIYFTDPKVAVGVFVQSEGKILLVRRTMQPQIGKWSIPAGFVDQGEDPQETAVREALEETNLHIAIEALMDVFYNPPGQGGASIFIMYQARLLGGRQVMMPMPLRFLPQMSCQKSPLPPRASPSKA